MGIKSLGSTGSERRGSRPSLNVYNFSKANRFFYQTTWRIIPRTWWRLRLQLSRGQCSLAQDYPGRADINEAHPGPRCYCPSTDWR